MAPRRSRRHSMFETGQQKSLSEDILGFEHHEELGEWITKDVHNLKRLFDWHKEVKDVFNDMTAELDRSDLTIVELQQKIERLNTERGSPVASESKQLVVARAAWTAERAELTEAHEAEREELAADYERKENGHKAVLEHYQDLLRESRDTTPASEASRASTITVKSTKLRDPPVLTDGKDPTLDNWLSLMKNKLRVNGDHYPSDEDKVAYVQTRIGGNAASHVQYRTRWDAVKPFKTADEFMDALYKAMDPDQKKNASRAFRELYQGSQDFNVFWAKFLTLSANCEHSERTLIMELEDKVSPDIRERLVDGSKYPTDLHEYGLKCQRIANRLSSIHEQSIRSSDNKPGNSKPSTYSSSRPAYHSKPNPKPATLATTTTTTTTPAVSKSVTQSTWVSREEKTRLRAEGRCFVCKKVGHVSSNCSSRPRSAGDMGESSNCSTRLLSAGDMGEMVQAVCRSRCRTEAGVAVDSSHRYDMDEKRRQKKKSSG